MESEIKVLLLSPPKENLLEGVVLLVPQRAAKISLTAPSHFSERKGLVAGSSPLRFLPSPSLRTRQRAPSAPRYCTARRLPLQSLQAAAARLSSGALAGREAPQRPADKPAL